MLRHLEDFFHLRYKISTSVEKSSSVSRELVTLSCVGVGFSNISKGMR